MSKTEMKVAIAESLGWKWWKFVAKDGTPFWQLSKETGWQERMGGVESQRPAPELIDHTGTPNYPEDLNAMREARQTLSKEEKRTYAKLLREEIVDSSVARNISLEDGMTDADWAFRDIDATAEQHAKTYLRTKGLWPIPQGKEGNDE